MLTLDKVSYSYKTKNHVVHAVREASYTFEKGKTYAVLGRSGSGKSTLLSMMAGLTLPESGQVIADGKSTLELDRDDYRRDVVSMVYQSFNLFPLLTALENVCYPLRLKGIGEAESRKQAEQCIEKVGLGTEYHKRLPGKMSGGEQQRIAIARALATNAPILLADEPTGNLDFENSQMIGKLLCALAHELDRCVIVVTHDTDLADVLDVRLKMADGKLMEN